MNIRIINQLCFILFTILFLACSEDQSNEAAPIGFDEDAKLVINTLSATEVSFALESETNRNLYVGLRKKGETEFKEVHIFSTNTGLDPGEFYEASLFVRGMERQQLFEILEFVTPPFDFLTFINSDSVGSNIFSSLNFEHQSRIGVEYGEFNHQLADKLSFTLLSKTNPSTRIELQHTIENGILVFTVPEGIFPDNGYQEYVEFNLEYTYEGTKTLIREYQNGEAPLNFVVFNPDPSFSELIRVDLKRCDEKWGYELIFEGFFMNFAEFFHNGIYRYENNSVIITRIDDGQQVILQKEDGGTCISYKQLFTSDVTYLQLPIIHTYKQINIKYPETVGSTFKFTAGDYTIKATFSKATGEYRETEEFAFSIPELNPIGFNWKLYKMVVNGVDVTQDRLTACDLEETLFLNTNGTFENRFYTGQIAENCSYDGRYTGTWEETSATGADEQTYIAYFDDDTNKEDAIHYFYNNNILREMYTETDSDGTTDVYEYFYELD